MLSVHDASGMREADRMTIEELGVPGPVLMENAATGLVEAIEGFDREAGSILLLCGPGNNGGDGFAAARHLLNHGWDVRVMLFAEPARLSGDAKLNYTIACNLGLSPDVISGENLGVLAAAVQSGNFDIIVDALMGTGLSRPLEGRWARIVDIINSSPVPVVAVDVPSGLQSSVSTIPGPVIEAAMTVTFGALKICQVLPPASELCGDLVVVDIGIPPRVLDAEARMWWVEKEDVGMMLPFRPPGGHKGDFGHLLILGGAAGHSGAVIMAAQAAVVGGSGLVTVAAPRSAVSIIDSVSRESMTITLPETSDGEFADPGGISGALKRMSAVVAGPGMGCGPGAERVLETVLAEFSGPILLDADALNIMAGRLEELKSVTGPLVLTPHPGELARLLGWQIGTVVNDRAAAAREAARRSGAVVIAKSHRSVIAAPDGEAWVIPVGDHHLAGGGSGDVLSGLSGAFLAQGLEGERAAIVAAYLHGRAGELGGDDFPAAVPAFRLPGYIARAWLEVE